MPECLPSPSRGGGKRGVWAVNPDGSGTWTRYDAAALRLQSLYMSGPKASEVTCRRTYDRDTDELIDETYRFGECRDKNAKLDPAPRSIRSVFHFDKTCVVLPPDAQPSMAPEAASNADMPSALADAVDTAATVVAPLIAETPCVGPAPVVALVPPCSPAPVAPGGWRRYFQRWYLNTTAAIRRLPLR